ncbi:hypothetical protein O181_092377 [Austropuccinia psidii MF-1]|uniref:Glycosyltransferase family 32 protein n=1 Tax=Austropuccinia psidii MF-1 TaxID=1389203 RepID=A0A9Q3IZC7_9BASI|nr:hypothetical protein [Austropuccinia psidii MF-1]
MFQEFNFAENAKNSKDQAERFKRIHQQKKFIKFKIFIKRFLSSNRFLKFVGFFLLVGLLTFFLSIETHIEIAFYRKSWISSLLPADPAPVSDTCFSASFVDEPFSPNNLSFPLSPLYNLSLGSLGLQPKVLSLSPGFNLPHHDDCYRFAASLPSKPIRSMSSSLDFDSHVFFHLYWRSDLAPLKQRQIVTLKSLLATQDFSLLPSTNSPRSQLIIWTNWSKRSLEDNLLLKPLLFKFKDRLSLRTLNIDSLTKNTPLDHHPILENIFDKRAWLDGDLVRVLVLWNLGGYWIDMDNLVLRDLAVLGEHEWVVMWDCYDKPYEPLNGHMMHFLKQSPYLCEMMHLMSIEPKPRPASTDWGQHLYYRLYRSLISSNITPFKVLPFCLTDGRSCTLKDRVPDPFASIDQEKNRWKLNSIKSKQLQNRLKGIFSIHLHNQWHKEFPKDGWIYRFYINQWEKQLQ